MAHGFTGIALRRIAPAMLCASVLLGAAGLAGAAERYELQDLSAPQTPAVMARCVGQDIDVGRLRDFLREALVQRDPSHALQLGGPRSPGIVLAAAGQWACVPLSAHGFPQWPVEAMRGLIVPVGVPADVTTAWRRRILEQVALDGVGRGLIVYPSGDADQVIVIAEQGQALHVKFTRRLLQAGEYREDQYAAVLRHPDIQRVVTRSSGPGDGTPKRLAIPPQRLMKPVDEGFVRIEASAATRSFDFEGTRWVVPGAPRGIVLGPNGVAMRLTDGAPDQGSWRVSDGVLQVAWISGVRYSLALQSDRATLAGMGRRAEAGLAVQGDVDDEGDEWQWATQWRLQGAPTRDASMRLASLRWPG